MLKAKEFGNREKAKQKKVILAIESQIRKQGGYIKDIKENEFDVWYLDTQRREPNRNHNFFLRIREEQNSYDITMKRRHPDRYISASYDLTHPANYSVLRSKGFKFEEDITPSKTIQQYKKIVSYIQ